MLHSPPEVSSDSRAAEIAVNLHNLHGQFFDIAQGPNFILETHIPPDAPQIPSDQRRFVRSSRSSLHIWTVAPHEIPLVVSRRVDSFDDPDPNPFEASRVTVAGVSPDGQLPFWVQLRKQDPYAFILSPSQGHALGHLEEWTGFDKLSKLGDYLLDLVGTSPPTRRQYTANYQAYLGTMKTAEGTPNALGRISATRFFHEDDVSEQSIELGLGSLDFERRLEATLAYSSSIPPKNPPHIFRFIHAVGANPDKKAALPTDTIHDPSDPAFSETAMNQWMRLGSALLAHANMIMQNPSLR